MNVLYLKIVAVQDVRHLSNVLYVRLRSVLNIVVQDFAHNLSSK